MDRKGIFSFLAITFGLTYAIELPALFSGLQLTGLTSSAATYFFLPVMFVPALAALLTVKFVTREGFKGLRLRFGPWKEYLAIGLLIPALFALVYGINWLFGLSQPDWYLEAFKSLFASVGQEAPAMPDTRLVLAGIFLGSLTGGALFNWLFCFGEDLGWRGYLLPKLLPLGKTRAYLLMGLIWSVWHWPLVWMGFTYNQPGSVLALVCFTLFTTALGTYLNELTLRTNSSIIAGWAHGVFNTQKVGLWFLLFPQVTPYLGGYAGLIGLTAWFGLAWWEMRRCHKAAAPVAFSQAAG